MRRTLPLVLLLVLGAGCGSDAPLHSENYGNLLASPGGLIVLQEEHPSGWGRQDCFLCHEIRNMHTVNRTGDPNLDLEEIQQIIQVEGEESCMLCHGTNGVLP